MVRPSTLAEALAAKAERPDLLPVAGGTDVMVGMNFGRTRPPGLLDLRLLPGLAEWSTENGTVRLGAGVPYTRIIDELGDLLPGLAMASRTVGSPQIRNAGTVGGNLGTSSPAGDAHPPLLASRATIEIASVRGTRTVPVTEFFTGVKRNVLAEDELVTAVMLPSRPGPQQFAKIGTRNAMVIAVCSFGLELDVAHRRVGAAIGSASPTPRVTSEAEQYLTETLVDGGLWDSRERLPGPVARRFGDLVADAASPVDDVRGSAAYRRHALAVLAARTLGWAWEDYRRDGRGETETGGTS
ncbi:MAG TPA: FAD binding domain-containing protein [Nakamurella sp.]|nr:FAD binding domain-containing protein [Nakamurella sp.]